MERGGRAPGDPGRTRRPGTGAPERPERGFPHGLPLGLAGAVAGGIAGLALSRGLALAPPTRLGELSAGVRSLAGVGLGLVWVAATVLVARRLARGGRQEASGLRAGAAALVAALVFAAPLASFDASRLIWRGRFLPLSLALLAVALAAGTLLRREAVAYARRTLAPGDASPVRRVALALGAGLLLVLAAESLLDVALFLDLRYVPDHAPLFDLLFNLLLNATLTAAAIGLVWAATGRLAAATVAVGAPLLVLAFADGLKLSRLAEPVRTLDLYVLSELAFLIDDFVPGGVWSVLVLVSVSLYLLVVALRRPSDAGPMRTRTATAAVSLAVLLAFFGTLGAEQKLRQRLLPTQRTAAWDARQASLANGLLLHLLTEGLASRVGSPEGYEPSVLEGIRRAHPDGPRDPGPGRPDVVLYVVESLLDPADLGMEFTEDPTPFLHGLMRTHPSGRSLSPVFGGRSANAEFELLTGLSMAFLPRGSLPYRQYVRRDLPSLPRSLAAHGWDVQAVLVDPSSFFNRRTALGHLGLDSVRWLSEEPGVPLDVTGRYATDEALVDAVLEAVSPPGPTFVYAFTNSTHAPYDRDRYSGPGPDLVAPADSALARELGGYVRALREADRALERLIEGLLATGEPAVLCVVGDHLPPFSGPAGVWGATGYLEGRDVDVLLRRYATPVVVWSSRAESHRELLTSHNLLGLDILRAAGVPATGLNGLLSEVAASTPVLSHLVVGADGQRLPFERAAGLLGRPAADYRLVQHDLLFGDPPLAGWIDTH